MKCSVLGVGSRGMRFLISVGFGWRCVPGGVYRPGDVWVVVSHEAVRCRAWGAECRV